MEPGEANMVLRDFKLQIANGEYEICDLQFLAKHGMKASPPAH